MVARFSPRGVRARTTLAATVVVAVVITAASVVFIALVRHELRNSLAEIARQRADDVAAQLERGAAGPEALALVGGDDVLVQIIDHAGRVQAQSPSIQGQAPLVPNQPADGETTTIFVDRLAVAESDPYAVVARGATGSRGHVTVIAAQSLEGAHEAIRVIAGLLVIGCPAMVIAVAAMSYWLTGRALAPVRSMRLRVAELTASDLNAEVPVSPAGDEISRLAETMNAMLGRLRAAAQTQRRFVADASHELRSPLTTIRATHEIALVHTDETDWVAASQDTLAETDRLDRLVSDLLLLARVDERGLSMRLEDVDLDDLISDEVQRLRRTTNLNVQTDLRPVRVIGDRHHLERMLRNLTENAAHHAASTVALSLQSAGSDAIIVVADDGPGIPLAERERVFDRFVRLDESRQRESGGAGLGLSIAVEIARAHGGSIRVDEAAKGAAFIVTLPLALTA
jgi:signal transduction histidine kinase